MNKNNSSLKRGQTLVEFALLLPSLIFIAIIIVDLGRAIYYYSAIHNAAREGARYGIINPDDFAGMEDTAEQYAIGLGLDELNVTAVRGPNQVIDFFPNPTVLVTIEYEFTPATPVLIWLIPGGEINLTSRALMRTEALPSTWP